MEMIPTGCFESTSLRTTHPIVPSPPATITVAVRVIRLSRSILGSNSTIRLPSNALRIFASTSGFIDPALGLRIKRLVARAVWSLTALI